MTGKWRDAWQESLDNRRAKLTEEERLLENLKHTKKELYDMERNRIIDEAMQLLLDKQREEDNKSNNKSNS